MHRYRQRLGAARTSGRVRVGKNAEGWLVGVEVLVRAMNMFRDQRWWLHSIKSVLNVTHFQRITFMAREL